MPSDEGYRNRPRKPPNTGSNPDNVSPLPKKDMLQHELMRLELYNQKRIRLIAVFIIGSLIMIMFVFMAYTYIQISKIPNTSNSNVLSSLERIEHQQKALQLAVLDQQKALHQAVSTNSPIKGSNLPIGTILPMVVRKTIPDGWLICDGQPITCSEYPELCKLLQDIHSTSDEVFAPDLFRSPPFPPLARDGPYAKYAWYIRAKP